MFKKFFVAFFAISFPWILMLKNDNPGAALATLIMQTTVIGWPFASMWAWRVEYPVSNKKINY